MNDEHTVRETLSARLKEAREYRGFSQEEVSRYLGIPRTAVSLMENGSRRVEALELRRLANLYQTTMDSLTGLDQEATEPGAGIDPFGGTSRCRAFGNRSRRSSAVRPVPPNTAIK